MPGVWSFLAGNILDLFFSTMQLNYLDNSGPSVSCLCNLLARSIAMCCDRSLLPTTEEESVRFPLKHEGSQVGSGSRRHSSWTCVRARCLAQQECWTLFPSKPLWLLLSLASVLAVFIDMHPNVCWQMSGGQRSFSSYYLPRGLWILSSSSSST